MYNKKMYLLEREMGYSKQERSAFMENLRSFGEYKNDIYRSRNLQELCEEIEEMINSAEAFIMEETKDGFDQVSVNKDLNELKSDFKIFKKTCGEAALLQKRLENAYENIGTKLGKYYEL